MLNLLRRTSAAPSNTATVKPVLPKHSSAHELLEHNLTTLRAERDAAVIRRDRAWFAGGGLGHNDRTRAATDEIDAIEKQIIEVRHSLVAHRHKHGKAMRQALKPALDAAAAEALEALATLEISIKKINALRTTVRRAGGAAPDDVSPMLLRAIRAPLRASLEG